MILGRMQRMNLFMQCVTYVVLTAFGGTIGAPLAQAMQDAGSAPAALTGTAEKEPTLSETILSVRDSLAVLAGRPDRLGKAPKKEKRADARDALIKLRKQLAELEDDVRREFAKSDELIRRTKLPDVIKDRQKEAVAKFNTEMGFLNKELAQVLAIKGEKRLKVRSQGLFERLNRQQFERTHQEFDPNQLPNGTLKADPFAKPRESVKEFRASGLFNNPLLRVAQAGGAFDYSQLPGADNPAYLAATEEVVLTPDIQAKAAALGNDPVRIYEWVRNNVHWQPTWGAIQDASHTLSSKRGNAFDIASLMISLMRASGIPSRYVHGTIDVPEDKFRNWVGGFQHIDAAMDFASAGGVPLGPVTKAGQITKVRMEHVWIEAAIDYSPSRGGVNRSADAWVALDASFNALEYLDGLDGATSSGADPVLVSNQFLASGSINATEGWSAGFNNSILSQSFTQARTSIEQFVDTNVPDATVGDVVGGRRILPVDFSHLSASPTNKTVAVGARYAALPNELEQRVTFAFSRDLTGSPVNGHVVPWARINNRRVFLSFRPASLSDEQVLTALLPTEVSDISDLPASVPAYLVKVVPELRTESGLLLAGPAVTLGADVTFVFDTQIAGRATIRNTYILPAGSYVAVAVIAGTVSPSILANARSELEVLESDLQSPERRGAVTRDQMLGGMFHSGLLAYFAEYMALGSTIGRERAGFHQLAAGLGTFGTEPTVEHLFGVPRRASPGPAVLNLPLVNVIGADSNDPLAKKTLTATLGYISSVLEQQVPSRMFVQSGISGQSISAAGAIARASSAGQRTYVITSQNRDSVLPLIGHDAQTMDEIRSYVSVGRIVITHASPVSIPGWTGAGYVAMDPGTGEAAWKISGGQNGAVVVLVVTIGLIAFFGWQLLFVGVTFSGVLALLGLISSFFDYVDDLQNVESPEELNRESSAAMLKALLVFFPVVFDFAEAAILGFFARMAVLGGELFN